MASIPPKRIIIQIGTQNLHRTAIPNHNSKHFKENHHQLTHKPIDAKCLPTICIIVSSEKPLLINWSQITKSENQKKKKKIQNSAVKTFF